MNVRSVVLAGFVLLFGTTVLAQSDHKLEATVDYSYVHANPQNNNIIPSFSLNGGGGSFVAFLTQYIGIEGELEGYGSYTHNINITNPVICPTPPCRVSAQGNLFTYNVGPFFKYRTSHIEPFVEALFGGAHSNFYGNLFKGCPGCLVAAKSPSNNAFDFIIGGGIDIPITERIAIRPAQVDYLLTRFGNAFTRGNNNQSNFRYQAGVQFRF